MEEIFSSKAFPSEEGFEHYSRITQSTFYDGDVLIEEGDNFDIQLDRILGKPVSIIHILSRSRMSYRRNSRHIRTNKAGFKGIWIVRSGSVTIHRTQGSCEIGRNQGGIVDLDSPFKAAHTPGADGYYEAFQAIVPPDIFFQHLSEAELFTDAFHLDGPHGEVAKELLDLISRHGDALQPVTTNALGLTLLDAIADHLRDNRFEMPQRRKISEKRMMEIENFIMMHASDPDISLEVVAENCGITPRYLSYLLKSRNTNFSDMLWRTRLPKAQAWLASADAQSLSIGQIAFMSGFKCASHFSRKFRQTYHCSPREFRARALEQG